MWKTLPLGCMCFGYARTTFRKPILSRISTSYCYSLETNSIEKRKILNKASRCVKNKLKKDKKKKSSNGWEQSSLGSQLLSADTHLSLAKMRPSNSC